MTARQPRQKRHDPQQPAPFGALQRIGKGIGHRIPPPVPAALLPVHPLPKVHPVEKHGGHSIYDAMPWS